MSEKYEIFDKWVDRYRASIDSDDEVDVPLKDLQIFGKIFVKAKISSSEEKLESPEKLRVVNDMGEKREDTLFIQIIQELEDEESLLGSA